MIQVVRLLHRVCFWLGMEFFSVVSFYLGLKMLFWLLEVLVIIMDI